MTAAMALNESTRDFDFDGSGDGNVSVYNRLPTTPSFLRKEDGAVATGWSNTKVTKVGSAGLVHGPWGSDNKAAALTVSVPSHVSECTVSWKSWAISTRDSEADSVKIDGTQVWRKVARHSGCRDG